MPFYHHQYLKHVPNLLLIIEIAKFFNHYSSHAALFLQNKAQ